MSETMKCAFCGKEGFLTFGELGTHVKTVCVAAFRKIASATPIAQGETKTMPRREGELIKAPKPEVPEQGEFHPWLTIENLGKKGTGVIKLLGNVRKSESEFGEGVVMDVSLNGDRFSWTIKFSSGNYARLHKRFGDSFAKWRGPVKVEVKQYMTKDYIAVV